MSGWGALAQTSEAEKEVVPEDAPIAAQAPVTSGEFVSSFPDIIKEMEGLGEPSKVSHVFCGMVGHEGVGKSGLVLDAHAHRFKEGEMLWALDFDNGAMACKQAHYRDDPRFRTFSPWVMQMEDRTAYDYIATYQRVMNIGKAAVEYASKQYEEGFEGPLLKTFLVTAVDQFDGMCMDIMKIYDLDMNAKDAIEASQSKLNQEIGWNWGIRSTRFRQLTALCRQLNSLGVDVFWETHLKEDRDGKVGFDGWKFAWEKSATNDLFQILWCKTQVMRNSDGSTTGEVRHYVDFFKEKTNSDLKGQERVYFVTKKGEQATWYGLAEMRDNML